MTPHQRLQLVHGLLLRSPDGVSYRRIMREFGFSKATTYRVIDRLKAGGADVVDGTRPGVFKYGSDQSKSRLPAFWLSDGEIAALLGLSAWVRGSEASILSDVMKPLETRLGEIAEGHGVKLKRLESVAVLQMNSRDLRPGVLRSVCQGLIDQRRLRINHGEKGEERWREVSPQKVVRYRDNWYLDAYCHLRGALRSFALFRIIGVEVLKEKARQIPVAECQDHFASAYGIFGGKSKFQAVLKFSGYAAKYIEGEQWHSSQEKSWKDGHLILKFPYGESKELVLDIMRWGPEVEVLKPQSLRDDVAERLKKASELYG